MKKFICVVSMAFVLSMAPAAYNHLHAQQTKVHHKTKKGKYVAIGAAAGAGTGVLVSKKKGKGALIGGAVGAGAGYLYGRHKQKKEQRKH